MSDPAVEHRGSPDRPDNRQQFGWDYQLHSADESGNVTRRLQEPDGLPLCARAVLSADSRLPARVPASENLLLVELAEFHSIFWSQSPPRHFWSRMFPLLGSAAMDILSPPHIVPAGRYSLHIRPPFSQDLQSAGAITSETYKGMAGATDFRPKISRPDTQKISPGCTMFSKSRRLLDCAHYTHLRKCSGV